jgi:hypothetical protein
MSPRFKKWQQNNLSSPLNFGGAGEIRTRDPLLAKQVLYQLSYDPEIGRLCCGKELLVLDIYFVRSTGTQKSADVAIDRFLRPSKLQPKLSASSP